MAAHDLLVSTIEYLAPEKLLDGLTGAQAAERMAKTPHTIVEIVAHLDFWQDWFLRRCRGEGAPLPQHAAEGWPSADAGDWDRVRGSFLAGLVAVAELDGQGAQRVEPEIEFPAMAEYTIANVITHVAIHNAHHLGQVATLRQMQGTWPSPAGSWTW